MWSNTMNRVWRGLALVFAFIMALAIGAAVILETPGNRIMVDDYLGTRSSQIVSEEIEGADPYNFKADYSTSDELVAADKALAEKLAEEGVVLFKNEGNTLPLAQGAKITLLGIRSKTPQYGGVIGSTPLEAQNIPPAAAFTQKGFSVNPTMTALYATFADAGRLSNSFQTVVNEAKYDTVNEPSVAALEAKNAAFRTSFAEYNAAAIVFIGRPSTEAADFFPGSRGTTLATTSGNILGLTAEEKATIKLATDNFSKVIVLVNSDSAMEIGEIKADPKVQAILWVGAPGSMGFLGVADILKGDVSPSGHISDIYAANSTSSPAMQNFGIMQFANTAEIQNVPTATADYRGNWLIVEAEGIYVGYKYYETRYNDIVTGKGGAASTTGKTGSYEGDWSYAGEVTYPFGYGLSYTTFSQTLDSVNIASNKKTATVKVTVKNTGTKHSGKDVVQLYAQAPYIHGTTKVEKAAVQLLDFEKTGLLAPGKSEQVTLNVDMQYLASYDAKDAKTYIIDGGDYYFAIGNGSHEAMNNILAKQGKTTSNGMDAAGDADKAYKWTWAADTTTFSTSKAKVKVTNQLEDSDLNYYLPGTVTYLSRNKWTETWPKTYGTNAAIPTAVPITANEKLIKQLKNDTYEIKTGGDPKKVTFGKENGLNIASMKGASFEDDRWEDILDQVSLAEAMDFVVRGQNQLIPMPSIGLLKVGVNDGPMGLNGSLAANSRSGSPWFLDNSATSTDPNKGYNARVIPTEVVIGATFSKELAYENGVMFGNDGIWGGTSFMWAPGMNLHRTPYNGRNHEYYSEDPILTGHLGSNVCKGALSKGMIMSPKHFAFNPQESNRAALAQFMTEQKARETELRGYQIAFEGGALGTMTSFSRIGATYANASIGLMRKILRGEWGFNGYIVTDMINGPYYMTLKESIIASSGTLDTNSLNAAWTSYWKEDVVTKDEELMGCIREALHTILYTVVNSNYMNGINSTSREVRLRTWWRDAYTAAIAVSASLFVVCAALYVAGSVLGRKEV